MMDNTNFDRKDTILTEENFASSAATVWKVTACPLSQSFSSGTPSEAAKYRTDA